MNKYLYFSKLLYIINANKELFLKTIAPDPRNLHYFLSTDVPKVLNKAFNQDFQQVPIKDITADIKKNSNCIVLFVEFDDSFVADIADCYAIAIAISPEDEIRLFTYEKGEDYLTKEETYYVGEFTDDSKHKNYGTTSEKRISLFSGVIMKVLNR